VTERIDKLKLWVKAVDVVFKMADGAPRGNCALLIATYNEIKTNAPDQLHDFCIELAQSSSQFEILWRRFRPETYKNNTVGIDVMIFVAHSFSTPGAALSVMTYLYLKGCHDIVDMVNNFMPNGCPSEAAIREIWMLQQIPTENKFIFSGNLVDDLGSVNELRKELKQTHGG